MSRSTLITIYKGFVRPQLDYGDFLYDQTYNNSFPEKLESVQYNACLYLTGAIRGSSKEKVYQELYLFYKVLNNEHHQYLFNLIPVRRTLHSTRNALKIPLLNTNQNFLKNLFFPSNIIEWDKLGPGLGKAEILSGFNTNIFKFIILKDLNLLLDLALPYVV